MLWNGHTLEGLKLVLSLVYPCSRAKETGSGFSFSFLFCLALARILTLSDTPKLCTGYAQFTMHLNSLEVNTIVARVNPIRVLEGSIESTTYDNWHDSSLLYMCKPQFLSTIIKDR
jgi:hypothetical protein